MNIINIPYKGSKSKIVVPLLKKMMELKPKAKVFIDLFAGGGNITFNVLSKFNKVIYNEFEKEQYDFIKYLVDRLKSGEKGNFGWLEDRFYKFYTKEEFNKIINNNQEDNYFKKFIKLVYSFSNTEMSYLVRKEFEYLKEMGHKFCFDINYKIKLNDIEIFNNTITDWKERRIYLLREVVKYQKEIKKQINIKNYQEYKKIKNNKLTREEKFNYCLPVITFLRNNFNSSLLDKITNTQAGSHYLCNNSQGQFALPSKQVWEKIKKYCNDNNIIVNQELDDIIYKRVDNLQQLQQLQQLQRLQRLEQLEQLQRLQQLELYNNSYEELDYILDKYNDDEIIIYCDPPYINTVPYNKTINKKQIEYVSEKAKSRIYKKTISYSFDYDKFYNWLRNHNKTIFISEYTMPSDFQELLRINVRCTMGNNNKRRVNECLFCNKKLENKKEYQYTIFDFI